MSRLLLLAAVSATAILVLGACGDDDDAADDDGGTVITPVGTKDATATPADTGAGNGAPPSPVEPQLDEALTLTGRGGLEATIEPGGRYEIDPLAIAEGSGNNVPPCANFQFDFSWQVIDPYPPDGVALSWLLNRMDGEIEVANGPSGNQAIGCGLLTAVNNGAAVITVRIEYAIGGIVE